MVGMKQLILSHLTDPLLHFVHFHFALFYSPNCTFARSPYKMHSKKTLVCVVVVGHVNLVWKNKCMKGPLSSEIIKPRLSLECVLKLY